MLSGEKQRIERQYNFCEICEWFAARCDLIFLLFDPYKLDISDEFKQVGAGGGRMEVGQMGAGQSTLGRMALNLQVVGTIHANLKNRSRQVP